MTRSKWLDPRRMVHGVKWRAQKQLARFRTPSPVIGGPPQGDSFRRAVLAHYGVEDSASLPETQKMWADFTLTAAERGFTAVGMLGGTYALKGKRVLDVGCGYGGFMVAAGRAGAREVVGIDTNPRVLELAPLLLSDYEVEARLEQVDLTDPAVPARLGRFDVIICNDVLEHVTSVETAVGNLSSMLARSGRVFLEIPNGNAVKYVRSDGHYKIPGITLLDFGDARRLHQAFFPDATAYDTYFYGTVDYYLAAFSRVGIMLRMLAVPEADPAAVELLAEEVSALQSASEEWPMVHADKPPELMAQIQERLASYLAEVNNRLARYRGLSDPAERELVGTSLRVSYEVGNWLFEGHRLEPG